MGTLTFKEIARMYADMNIYDIQVYISYIFDIPQSQVKFKSFNQNEINIIQNVFKKLKSGMPLQYILEKAYFYSRKFYVNENVLIPRFDTEILVENAIQEITKKNLKNCLDLCCGSGAIGITINLETGINVTCSDISEDALNITRKNAHQLGAKIATKHSDLFQNINEKFDIIVSNPPYIPTADIQQLDSVVKDYEPHLALDGKQDGLHFYKKIILNLSKFLNKNGIICFEVGINQAKQVAELLIKDFKNVKIIKDYNNIERVVTAQLC